MGFQSMSEYNAPPVFQTLVSHAQTSNAIVAFKLDGNVVQSNGDITWKSIGGSELSIGGLNSKIYHDPPFYIPITQEGHWQIAFDSFTVDSFSIFDTSTSAILDSVRLFQLVIFLTNIS
jgi:cathepsin D